MHALRGQDNNIWWFVMIVWFRWIVLSDLKAYIQRSRRVCQFTDRDIFHARLRYHADSLQVYAAGDFQRNTARNKLHGFAYLSERIIIEHDPIHPADGKNFFYLRNARRLYLDLHF